MLCYFVQNVLHIILALWSVNRYYVLRRGKVLRSNEFRKHCIKQVFYVTFNTLIDIMNLKEREIAYSIS